MKKVLVYLFVFFCPIPIFSQDSVFDIFIEINPTYAFSESEIQSPFITKNSYTTELRCGFSVIENDKHKFIAGVTHKKLKFENPFGTKDYSISNYGIFIGYDFFLNNSFFIESNVESFWAYNVPKFKYKNLAVVQYGTYINRLFRQFLFDFRLGRNISSFQAYLGIKYSPYPKGNDIDLLIPRTTSNNIQINNQNRYIIPFVGLRMNIFETLKSIIK